VLTVKHFKSILLKHWKHGLDFVVVVISNKFES